MVRSVSTCVDTWVGMVTESVRNTAKPFPDVLNKNELQVQQMILGVLVLVAAIWTWESFQR